MARGAHQITISQDPAFAPAVERFYREIDGHFTRLAPSLLVRIPRAVIWDNMIFALTDDGVKLVYECYRQIDRAEKGPDPLSRFAACESRERLDLGAANALFVGSAGSFNYGHWVVDDFPAFAATDILRAGGREIAVLMARFSPEIDRTRKEGAALALGERRDFAIRMLDRATAYTVENLHYVTPASYHPVGKNPEALSFIRDLFGRAAFDAPSFADSDRIFVNRSGGLWRKLLNGDAVGDLLARRGYAPVNVDALNLREQWATFAQARQVVGIMGAAMTSSVLCPVGTPLTYLAPDGWMEPFYWDLAAACGHRYAALFGPTDDPEPQIYRRNFSVDLASLERHLDRF
ncbi:glycosyltransferase family 61 protein [Methylobacterium trifolii]|uniref:glycosyltransferase family 61 protein n=1 Tax=Methylobacterium trifolii TaxID=1003092 RepID=UPI001EE0DF51|nr:glycosyltransferase 61 family protein [Methylobacterium trifolii]